MRMRACLVPHVRAAALTRTSRGRAAGQGRAGRARLRARGFLPTYLPGHTQRLPAQVLPTLSFPLSSEGVGFFFLYRLVTVLYQSRTNPASNYEDEEAPAPAPVSAAAAALLRIAGK